MKLIAVASCFLLAGCGKGPEVDERFQAYRSSFVAALERAARENPKLRPDYDVDIVMVPRLEGQRGVCRKTSLLEAPTVLISEESWNDLGESDRELLIYHELTHCMANIRSHSPSYKSYMYPMIGRDLSLPVLEEVYRYLVSRSSD